MKKCFYSTVMMLAMIVAAVGFTACSSDDDDNVGDDGQGGNGVTLTINGVAWQSSTENMPLFYGNFASDENHSAGLVFTKFVRKEKNEMQLFFPDSFSFDICMKPNCSIVKGMDLATSEDVVKFGGNAEYRLYEGFSDADGVYNRYGTYTGANATGSAVVVDFKEKEFFTIKFSNFRIQQLSETGSCSDNAYKTLTIDGTVTYKYTDSLSDVGA